MIGAAQNRPNPCPSTLEWDVTIEVIILDSEWADGLGQRRGEARGVGIGFWRADEQEKDEDEKQGDGQYYFGTFHPLQQKLTFGTKGRKHFTKRPGDGWRAAMTF